MSKHQWAFVIAVTLCSIALAIFNWPPRDPYAKYSLIHMPASGKCPAGFVVVPKVFSRAGKSYAGCARQGGQPVFQGGMIDEIGPGESVEMFVPLPDLGPMDSPSPKSGKI